MTPFFHSNFLIAVNTSYRLDRDSNGRGIISYLKEDIPSNLTAIRKKPTESILVQLNLRNETWLIK